MHVAAWRGLSKSQGSFLASFAWHSAIACTAVMTVKPVVRQQCGSMIGIIRELRPSPDPVRMLM
jgi:hypothetical protein